MVTPLSFVGFPLQNGFLWLSVEISQMLSSFSPHLFQLLTLHLMHILESDSSTSPIPSCFEVNICGEVLICSNLWRVFAQESCFFHLLVTQNPTNSHKVFISIPTDRSLCSCALCFASVKTEFTLCCIFPCLKRQCYISLSLYRLYTVQPHKSS